MNQGRRVVLQLLVTAALAAAITGFSSASAPPVGWVPGGPVSTIATQKGQLVAVALPERAGGLGWRIARAFDGNVLTEVHEQSGVAGNLVIVFKATGAGATSVTFALTRGERGTAYASRRFDVKVG